MFVDEDKDKENLVSDSEKNVNIDWEQVWFNNETIFIKSPLITSLC